MRLLAVLVLAGCFAPVEPPPPPPEPQLPWPVPAPVLLPPPPCWDRIAGSLPVAMTGTTGDRVEACGSAGPGSVVLWTVPGDGPYAVTATARFPLAVEVHDGTDGTCSGPSLACAADGATTFTATAGHLVAFAVVARDGAGGRFQLELLGPAGTCGDATCGAGEDCASCPGDCGECPAVCGDGACTGGEDCSSCAADCGDCPPPSYCGDGTCDVDESCASCPTDCGTCSPPSFCGDLTCDVTESCWSCSIDCGPCQDP